MITIKEIKSRDRVRFGKQYPGAVLSGCQADIDAGRSIRLYGSDDNTVKGSVNFDLTFRIGDNAEYDSYNLTYTGIIVKIGAKSITIEAYPGTLSAKKHRLSIYDFSWRNRDFDLKKIEKQNSEEMMCI